MGNKNAAAAHPPQSPAPVHNEPSAVDPSRATPAETARKVLGVDVDVKTYSNKLTVDDFDLLKVIGKGSFGKVMQVRKKDTGKIYAMKILKKKALLARKQVAHTKSERKILEEIDHPFIVSLRFAFQSEDKLYMVLDYFAGGELFFHLKKTGRFSEDRARIYAAEIVAALECLHGMDIVYRDLKPENILLDEDGHIRLTDFGLSKEQVTETKLTHTFCGTPEYLAPEVLQGVGHGKAVDWWSLGTMLYEMLTGLPPFYDQNINVMYERILKARLSFPSYLSAEAKSLLEGLLERDPRKRLGGGPNDALDIRRHPFFAPLDWDALLRKEIAAPFRPEIHDGIVDTTNFDEEFTRELPRDTPVNPSRIDHVAKDAFPGFTYVDQSQIGK